MDLDLKSLIMIRKQLKIKQDVSYKELHMSMTKLDSSLSYSVHKGK